jgi:hypothetical protein
MTYEEINMLAEVDVCDPNHDLNCARQRFGTIAGEEYFLANNPQMAGDRANKARLKETDEATITTSKIQQQDIARSQAKSEAEAIILNIERELGLSEESWENRFIKQYESQINSKKQAYIKAMEALALASRDAMEADSANKHARAYVEKYFSCFRDSPSGNIAGCEEIRNRKVKEREAQTQKTLDEANSALSRSKSASEEARKAFFSLVKLAIDEAKEIEMEVDGTGNFDGHHGSLQETSLVGNTEREQDSEYKFTY